MPEGFFHKSELVSRKVQSMLPKCGACQLFQTCHSPKMPVSGDGRRKILIIGEAPGEQEDKQNKPFVGKTGKKLEETLARYGIDMRKDCWITNALICRPPDNEAPTEKQIEYCRPNVIKAIQTLKPEMILLVGGAAVKSVIQWLWKDRIGTMERWVGWQIPSQKLNAWVCPIWHPSFVVRTMDEGKSKECEVIWRRHVKDFAQLSGRPWKVVPDYEKQVRIIFDIKEAEREIRKISAAGGVAAFDYETNMLKPDWQEARIICASICHNGDNTIAFPWSWKLRDAMAEFVSSDVKKIASNLKFEDRWSRARLARRVRNFWWCTMTGAHVMDNRREITSIKFQSFVLLGAESYNDEVAPFLKTKGDQRVNQVVREVEMRRLLLYCGLDSLLEYHTGFKQRRILGYANS